MRDTQECESQLRLAGGPELYAGASADAGRARVCRAPRRRAVAVGGSRAVSDASGRGGFAAAARGLSRPRVAAGVPHDVLEDTDTQRAELEQRFGSAVSDLVAAVSDDPAIVDEETQGPGARARSARGAIRACPLRSGQDLKGPRALPSHRARARPSPSTGCAAALPQIARDARERAAGVTARAGPALRARVVRGPTPRQRSPG